MLFLEMATFELFKILLYKRKTSKHGRLYQMVGDTWRSCNSHREAFRFVYEFSALKCLNPTSARTNYYDDLTTLEDKINNYTKKCISNISFQKENFI